LYVGYRPKRVMPLDFPRNGGYMTLAKAALHLWQSFNYATNRIVINGFRIAGDKVVAAILDH
jgi:hypothetical protein